MKVKTKTKTFGKKPLTKRRNASLITKKRFCRFCHDKVKSIDYKDFKRLESFVTERGKILTSRISGNCAKHQRRIAEGIKKARFLSLIPYLR